jgi:hypothetical protein
MHDGKSKGGGKAGSELKLGGGFIRDVGSSRKVDGRTSNLSRSLPKM